MSLIKLTAPFLQTGTRPCAGSEDGLGGKHGLLRLPSIVGRTRTFQQFSAWYYRSQNTRRR